MEPKHQPATLLPWKAGRTSRSSNFGDYVARIGSGSETIAKVVGGYPDTEERATMNAAYVQHAANAYPKLVETMRRVRERILARAEAKVGINAEQRAALHDIDALLRELGEQE